MVTEESLRNAEIEKQFTDYLGMPTQQILDEKGNAIKIDPIVFWQDHTARFPDIINLALTMVAIPASSAAAERLFSVSGWHYIGRKDRLDKANLAAKTFISCNKDLLRESLFQ